MWLRDRGGNGIIDQYGRVVAQGERYKSGETAQVWLRLVASGHVIGADNRLHLSPTGINVSAKLPRAIRSFLPMSSQRGPLMVDDDPSDFA